MAYKLIEGGGVTTPKGFLAGACYVGVKSRKSEKPDVAIIYSEQPASCAAMFTTNKFCAAPVILDREILKKGKARAVVINSGNANAATGEQGIKDAKTVETEAEKLLGLLPEKLRGAYEPLLRETDADTRKIVKAADKLAAYLKCREELAAGNSEFADAEKETLEALRAMDMPEVEWFLENFAGAFGLTLDGLQRG